ncbi:MAG: prepilin-type N-terminal cleavage/methylation domain-containing protein [Planctomycetota bacterium]
MPDRPSPQLRPRPGFTLIELIVSVSITAIILLIVGRIFNDTGQTIGRGADVSQIIAESRTIHDQLLEDTNRMLVYKSRDIEQESDPAGFLVIVQELQNTGITFPADPTQFRQSPRQWTDEQPIRTDQMFFFASADQLASIVPGTDVRYDSDARAITARIWWGHASPPRFNAGGNITGGLFPPQGTETLPATDLVLGRQALLLLDEQGFYPDGTESSTSLTPTGANRVGELTTDFSIAAGASFTVVGNLPTNAVTTNNRLWQSPTDVLRIFDLSIGSTFRFDMSFEEDPRVDPSFTFDAAGFYSVNAPSGFSMAPLYERTRPDVTLGGANNGVALNRFDLPTLAYGNSATTWGYGLFPNVPRLIAQGDIDYPYGVDEVARTHTFFAPYVSDFIVEFAADIRDDLGDDPSTPEFDPVAVGTPQAGGIGAVTLDGHPDNTPDTINATEQADAATLNGVDIPVGAIKWYSLIDANDPTQAGFDPSRPITWRLPDPVANPYHTPAVANNDPSSISGTEPTPGSADTNIGTGDGHLFGNAYPPLFFRNAQQAIMIFAHTADRDYYDDDGAYAASTTTNDPGFLNTNEGSLRTTITNDGRNADDDWESGAAKWWPYMLRIRYRLHDGDGSFSSVDENSGDSISGKWFEQIVPIPRRP